MQSHFDSEFYNLKEQYMKERREYTQTSESKYNEMRDQYEKQLSEKELELQRAIKLMRGGSIRNGMY